jgi:hypothetical protein
MYLAGRLHARVGYRFGYRYGYRQGYFDGDRACWNRRRREAQADQLDSAEPAASPAPLPRGSVEDDPAMRRRPDEDTDAYALRSRRAAGLEYPDVPPADLPVRDSGELPGTTYASTAALGRHWQDGYPVD